MQTPFIQNHQYNEIRKQVNFLLKAMRTVADRKVLDTVRSTTVTYAIAAFDELNVEERHLLEQLSNHEAAHELQNYLDSLEAYIVPFPHVTQKQIQKLFPKVKKLKVPDLEMNDYNHTTYLRWIDIATNRLFIVYPYKGQLVGLEGSITPINKKGYCMFCNRQHELGFFNVKTKKGGSQDNFSSIGQYVCMDGEACNHNITDPAVLERFIHSTGK